MARVPISFYLSILAGILVLFHHYASSETGDVALNKVTGAASRFYTLARDITLTLQHGWTSGLETAFCGPLVHSVLPHDAAEYLRVRYQCQTPAQNSESVGGTSNDRQPHGRYGSSDLAFVYYRPPARPPAEGLLRRSPFSLEGSSQSHLSRVVWDRCSEAMATIGVLLLRTYASWWWFRAPFKMMGVLLAGYSALSALGYLFGVCVVISQVYMIVAVDFLRCMEWEAQRQVSDIGVVMMERAYGVVKHARKRI